MFRNASKLFAMLPTTPLDVSPTAPLFIVLNTGSGSHDAGEPEATIRQVLTDAGREFHLRPLQKGTPMQTTIQQAVRDAKAQGGVVVAAGGDGTINAVAAATLGSGCPFGVLPQGTFNYFGRTHAIPEDTADATRLLLSGTAWPVQVGLINDRVFLVNASLGLYPQLLEDREAYKSQFGRSRLVALGSALVTLLREHRQLKLRIAHAGGTRVLRTPTLFVGNNALQLQQIGLPEATQIAHGQLAAVLLKPVSNLAMLGLLARGALGQLGEADDVLSFAFDQITVSPAMPYGKRRIKVATDGEIGWAKAPLQFRVSPQPLYLLKPAPVEA